MLRKTPEFDPEHFMKIKRMKRKLWPRTPQERGKNRLGSRQNWGKQGGDFGGWGPGRFFPVGRTLRWYALLPLRIGQIQIPIRLNYQSGVST